MCDLAGTEPAGDVFYADYKRIAFEDGTVEHKLIGPNRDTKKTKELQDQGKMINLSLSEMAQFFMKMADAVKKKKLKPGGTIPGYVAPALPTTRNSQFAPALPISGATRTSCASTSRTRCCRRARTSSAPSGPR